MSPLAGEVVSLIAFGARRKMLRVKQFGRTRRPARMKQQVRQIHARASRAQMASPLTRSANWNSGKVSRTARRADKVRFGWPPG